MVIKKNNLIYRFKDCINETLNNPKLKVTNVQNDFLENYDDEYINSEAELFFEDNGFKLSEEVKEFCCFPANPLTLSWVVEDDFFDYEVAGGFSLRELDACLNFDENKYIIHNPDLSEGIKKILSNSYYFDIQPDVFHELATLLKRINEELNFWYIEFQSVYKLDLDLKIYLEALLITRGITNWQLFFCEKIHNKNKNNILKEKLDRILFCLKYLFPNTNFKILEERYAFHFNIENI
ncbi:hypothetical protein EV195_107213 [Tenacibaculum skagerrakense]|uniref:Uncharacterized protein n=1 Tax=Tenacibaculum skagerrakense TaxID=186571 RepID=A0A4R2NQK0_9FLAO|nr:hypothetical protein [Tenacibaculum skagerrakense]TCP24047.1 hypothetical protein EV195_107213 [Tenacibaculum skagerrakense]